MNATKVIGLWLDTHSEPGSRTWIVSRDSMNCRGQAETTQTIDTYAEEDYADALIAAKDAAQRSGLCVIETATDGSQECIYQPDGTTNPLALA